MKTIKCHICETKTNDYFPIAKSVMWVNLCRDCFKHRKKELYKEKIESGDPIVSS